MFKGARYPSPIVTVASRPGYQIGLEQRGPHTFAHCLVTGKWSRGLFYRLQHDVNTIFNLHGGPIHTVAGQPHANDHAKHAKFCALLGFKFNQMLVLEDGTTRACYTRTE